MKNILITILISFIFNIGVSQSTFNKFDYWYGNSSNTLNCADAVVLVGNYLYVATTIIDTIYNERIAITKTNLLGDTIKKIDMVLDSNLESGYYPGHAIIMDKDSNIVVVSFIYNNLNGNSEGLIVKLNLQLDTMWTRIYNLPDTIAGCIAGQNPRNYFTCIKEDPNGGYILGGTYWANCVTNNSALYMTKYDTAGNVLWVRTYPSIEGVFDFEIAYDSGYFVASKMNSTPKIIKIDKNGIYQWNLTTFPMNNSSWPLEVEILDSTYLIVSCRFRYDFSQELDALKVSKINYLTKQQVWSKDYYLFRNLQTPDINQYFKMHILPTKDILIAGTSQVMAWDSLTGGFKGILFKLNNNGDSLWTRYYHTTQSFNDDDVFCDVELMDDGGFLAVGYHKPWVEQLNWAAWMVRTDSLGNAPMDGSVSIKNEELEIKNIELKIYPNPANNYLTLDYKTASKTYKELWVEIRDAQGKLVMKQQLKGGDNEELIGLKDLKSGHYSVNLIADQKVLKSELFTIL